MADAKFVIAKKDLEYIFKALGPAVAASDAKIAHQYMKFSANNDLLAVFACDGYRLNSVTVPIKCESDSEEFSFLLKPFPIPKDKIDTVSCQIQGEHITFDFFYRRYIEKLGKTEHLDDWLDVDGALPKGPATMKIAFNPKYLMEAAKSLDQIDRLSYPVVLEIRDPLTPMVMYQSGNRNNYRMVLPVRLKEGD